RGEAARPVDDVKMEMRRERAAGIAEETEHVAGLHPVANLHLDAARPEMGVDGGEALIECDRDVIAGVLREGKTLGHVARGMFFHAIACNRHDAGTDGQDLRSEAGPALEL